MKISAKRTDVSRIFRTLALAGVAGGADEASAVALMADDDFHLTGGWYKVGSDLTIDHTVNLHGDTHITIATGATLTVSTSDQYGIYGSALTVSGEGTLNVSANERAISVDNYTQMGCAVTLSGNTDGLTAENNVSISGGFPSASFTGTIDDPSALNGLMLRPSAAVTESGTFDGGGNKLTLNSHRCYTQIPDPATTGEMQVPTASQDHYETES